jgi:arylsulfatase A-like enzyme
MTRSLFLLEISLLVSLGGCNSGQEVRESGGRPNILWISVEDISPRLGCYGDPLARTPTFDQLAAEGMRFTSAFTTAGVCAPSRAAIITGMYQTSIGAHHMRTTHEAQGLPTPYFTVPPPEVKAFTEYLRAAGYFCTNNSKTDYQFGVPVTAWDESSTTAHWKNRKKDQPFFAVFNFTTTHESRIWPRADKELQTDPGKVTLPPYYPDTPLIRQDYARHYDNIAEVDRQAAEILKQLEEDGLAEDTVVLFWSDHGDGLPRAKRWLYDSGLHVPLVVRWPGQIEPGTIREDLISFIDLAPTMLSLAGFEIPAYMQGRAFLGPQARPPRKYIHAARDRIDESYDRVRAVRDERYKLIRNFYPEKPYILPVPYRDRMLTMQELLRLDSEDQLEGPQKLWMQEVRPHEELYDLYEDPHEIDNLVDKPGYSAIASRLRTELNRWIRETGDMGAMPENEMVERMWPGGTQPATQRPILNPFGGVFEAMVLVTASCPTEGSSIAYTTEEGDQAHWLLYHGPLPVERTGTLRFKAIRYGFKESGEAIATFTIQD